MCASRFSPRRSFAARCALLLGLTACGGPVEDTRPGQPVKSRQEVFKEMLRTFEPMGTMLRTSRYEPEKFAVLAADLFAMRDAPWHLFTPDTHYPPTKAKPAVWSQPELFEQERQAFLGATETLLAAAQNRDADTAGEAYFKVYNLCQSCHRQFKER